VNSYTLVQQPGLTTSEFVWFTMREPTDEDEACLSLSLSRASWQSQGSPPELTLTLATAVGW
jgi:hypothetical protein